MMQALSDSRIKLSVFMGRQRMELWSVWMSVVVQLRPACKRYSTFCWMVVCLMAFSIRPDLMGVSSMVRAIGLKGICYERLLGLMHSKALDLDLLTELWCKIIFSIFPDFVRVNGRIALLADGIKIGKEGRKMPAVKSLHQESNNNSKAEYIMGHSCQTISVLVKAGISFFAVPLVSRIHEGLVFSNRDRRTLFDKVLAMLGVVDSNTLFYFIADAYYSNCKMMAGLVERKQHLIACVKQGMAVGYLPLTPQTNAKPKRGRPRKYGDKIKLKTLFKQAHLFTEVESPVYDEQGVMIKIYSQQLLCKSAGMMILFIWVIHPKRGNIILMSTDLEIAPIDVVRLYGLRFKIECSFKAAIHNVGTYTYRFWMKSMDKINSRGGDQHLHHKSSQYRDQVRRKMAAYHCHIQLGLIAQGLLQYLSCTKSTTVWQHFYSWIRTIRPGIPPSEYVVSQALKDGLTEFLEDPFCEPNFKKFLLEKIDFSRQWRFYRKAA